jgi:hypothetical protein
MIRRSCLALPAVPECRPTDLLACGGCDAPALREQTWIGYDGFDWRPFCVTCDPAGDTRYPDDPATLAKDSELLEIVE